MSERFTAALVVDLDTLIEGELISYAAPEYDIDGDTRRVSAPATVEILEQSGMRIRVSLSDPSSLTIRTSMDEPEGSDEAPAVTAGVMNEDDKTPVVDGDGDLWMWGAAHCGVYGWCIPNAVDSEGEYVHVCDSKEHIVKYTGGPIKYAY